MNPSITSTPATPGPVDIDAKTFHQGNSFTQHGTVLACLEQDSRRQPLVTLNTFIGYDATMRPDQLRALAAKLTAIAEDAERRPMGARTFRPVLRRY